MAVQAQQSVFSRLRFKNWRISTKISALMVAMAVLPVLLLNLITSQQLASAVLTDAGAALNGSTKSGARVLVDEISQLGAELLRPEYYDYFREYLRDTSRPMSEDAKTAFASLAYFVYLPTEAVLVDADTKVWRSSNAGLEGQRLPNDAWIRAALEGQSGVLGVQFKGSWRDPALLIGAPIRESDTGPIIGAVVTGYDTGRVNFLSNDTLLIQRDSSAVPEAINLFTINREGMILSTPANNSPPRFAFIGEASDPTLRSRYAAAGALGQICASEYVRETGQCTTEVGPLRTVTTLLSYQPVWEAAQAVLQTGEPRNVRYCRPATPDQRGTTAGQCEGEWLLAALSLARTEALGPSADLVVVAEMPEQAVLGQVLEQRNQGLLVAGGVGLLAILIALLIGRSFSQPIQQLGGVALKVESGAGLDTAAVNKLAATRDEIGDLARVFGAAVGSLHARNEELRTIYEIGMTISRSIDLEKTLQDIAVTLRKAVPYDWAEICLYDQAKNQMIVQVAADHDSVEMVNVQPYPADQGYIGLLISRNKGLYVPNVAAFTGAPIGAGRSWNHLQPMCYLGVPLKVKDQVVGTVEMVARAANALTEDHLRLLESVAVQAAVAVQNAREVQNRESALKAQIQELKIVIDESKRQTDVQAITESSYFQELQSKAGQLRQRKAKSE